MGEVQLAALLAAIELACRMAEAKLPDRELFNRPVARGTAGDLQRQFEQWWRS